MQDQQERTNGPEQPQAMPQSAGEADDELRERLADAEQRLSDMEDAFLRAKAETENIRRRAQEEVARAGKFAIEEFAEALIPVKDSLEAALQTQTDSLEALREGVEMTSRKLASAFEKNQLQEIDPAPGEKMDPMKHHAISMVAADQEANTVVDVLQKGYTIADRLLRPALVTVARAEGG